MPGDLFSIDAPKDNELPVALREILENRSTFDDALVLVEAFFSLALQLCVGDQHLQRGIKKLKLVHLHCCTFVIMFVLKRDRDGLRIDC